MSYFRIRRRWAYDPDAFKTRIEQERRLLRLSVEVPDRVSWRHLEAARMELARQAKLLESLATSKPLPEKLLGVEVHDGYAVKDDLKERGYTWYATARFWFRAVQEDDLSAEEAWLRELGVPPASERDHWVPPKGMSDLLDKYRVPLTPEEYQRAADELGEALQAEADRRRQDEEEAAKRLADLNTQVNLYRYHEQARWDALGDACLEHLEVREVELLDIVTQGYEWRAGTQIPGINVYGFDARRSGDGILVSHINMWGQEVPVGNAANWAEEVTKRLSTSQRRARRER